MLQEAIRRLPDNLAELVHLRYVEDLTQAELALRTGLPMSLLCQLESRDHPPSPRTWTLLARTLGLEPASLLAPP